MNILNPITKNRNVVLEEKISISRVIREYRDQLHVNVRRFFRGHKEISIYRCLDTGYRFYYPFNLAGDSLFYQRLERFRWYYMDWKWEQEIAQKEISHTDVILEIGCARGGFLDKVKTSCRESIGLETNQKALTAARKRGLSAFNQTIEEYAKANKRQYDVVCSFQVLEHIPDVQGFILSSLAVLKKGGKMIISVPNNDSLVIRNNNIALNFPPHHMGLWNLNSLIKIQNFFDIRLDKILLEPLQPYHLGFAQRRFAMSSGKLIRLMPKSVTAGIIEAVREDIIGHTIMAVYIKK
ncbi:MAG: methyltransferase domain-containing protein [Patescibacteria group bacterium]|nr:methyltransferase domain-containing protein [Patescibacteria group bacterium]MCL5431595.1 methyltransferase domain-containing protein [Patescibacteria group bacterium]